MASGWYYTQGGTRHGPVTSRELAELARAGQLRPDDSVWKDGMAGWRPASDVKGLFPERRGTPPPPPDPDVGQPLGLDVAGVVDRIRGVAASAARRVEAALAGGPHGSKARPPEPLTAAGQPDGRPPAGPGGGSPPSGPTGDGGGAEPAAAVLVRVERLLQKVHDTAVPTAGLDAELAALRRAVEARQAQLRREQEAAARDGRESRRHRDALAEAVRLASAARDARAAGRAAEAARLDAEADAARAGVPRRNREERRAELDGLRDRLEHLRVEGKVMAGALGLLRDAADGIENRRRIEALARGQPPAAGASSPPAAAATGEHPASGFGAWYARAFGLLAGVPPAVAWPVHAGLWTFGLGFLWVPMLYFAGKSLSCPACGRLWVRTTEGEQLLGRRQGYGRVTREDGHYDRDGRYTGSTRRTEQVVVNDDLVRVHYACKGCGHRWAAVEGRTSEA